MPYKDARKQKAAQRASYERTKEQRMKKQAADRHEMRRWMLSLKQDRPCSMCDGVFHPAAMHWHHRPETDKVLHVAGLASSLNRQLVLDEITKCDLVCANCHAVLTFGENYVEDTYGDLACVVQSAES